MALDVRLYRIRSTINTPDCWWFYGYNNRHKSYIKVLVLDISPGSMVFICLFPKIQLCFLYYSIVLFCCRIFLHPFFNFTSLWSRGSIRDNLSTPTKVGLRPTHILPFPEPTCGITLGMLSFKNLVIIHHKRRMKLILPVPLTQPHTNFLS